jgi:hypothetical protein
MLYEDKLLRFAVAAMGQVEWEHGTTRNDETRAARAMAIAVATEAAFSATLKARRDAAERTREDAARAEAAPAELPGCDWTAGGVTCGEPATARRAQRGFGGPVRSFCAAHEAEGDSLGYWLPKVAP